MTQQAIRLGDQTHLFVKVTFAAHVVANAVVTFGFKIANYIEVTAAIVILQKIHALHAIVTTKIVTMKHTINSTEDLGFALRAVRKSAKLRLDDLSQSAGVSKQTTVNFEKGKPTVQFGTILQLLKEVGLTLSVDLPESALPALLRIQKEAHERSMGLDREQKNA